MKTVILNGARSGDLKVDEVSEVLSSMLQSRGEVNIFKLREIKIADCLGCFGCWIKTPGECIIDDAERDIAKRLAYADLKIYLTPIIFGGYSYELKKALDRQICNILPFFTKVKGEVHHPSRYEQSACFVGIGVLPKSDMESETIFKTLVCSNAINMHAKSSSTTIIYLNDNSKETLLKIKDAFVEVGLNDEFN
jgi:multimeric flavodoxin WrbA